MSGEPETRSDIAFSSVGNPFRRKLLPAKRSSTASSPTPSFSLVCLRFACAFFGWKRSRSTRIENNVDEVFRKFVVINDVAFDHLRYGDHAPHAPFRVQARLKLRVEVVARREVPPDVLVGAVDGAFDGGELLPEIGPFHAPVGVEHRSGAALGNAVDYVETDPGDLFRVEPPEGKRTARPRKTSALYDVDAVRQSAGRLDLRREDVDLVSPPGQLFGEEGEITLPAAGREKFIEDYGDP